MNYDALLDVSVDLGYELAMAGAETYRIEESIYRVLLSYGLESEIFSIPNSLIVSIETPDGKNLTRLRRLGQHGNNLDAVERISALCRTICSEKPDPSEIPEMLRKTRSSVVRYGLPLSLSGSFMAAAGFGLFFGGTWADTLWSGILGCLICLINHYLNAIRTNHFFSTITASFLMALSAYGIGELGLTHNADASIMGAVMLLVPGLLFTNAMRDIIYGDTNSGVNRIAQVFLISAGIALGTAAAWHSARLLWGMPADLDVLRYGPVLTVLGSCIGCAGFTIVFNVHGKGAPLCALGGGLTWIFYLLVVWLGGSDLIANFVAALFTGIYAETMARIRKHPAISYLVVSLLPLIPGGAIYRTVNFAVRGNMTQFASSGLHTAAVAGILAVGVLMASTIFRMFHLQTMRKHGITLPGHK